MRDKYYSDNRDLVKWATLAHIASRYRLKTILQVPYWRRETAYPHLNFMGNSVAVSGKVWGFFRNLHSVTLLGPEIGVSIAVAETEFDPNRRGDYLSVVKTRIQQARRPLVLFLDPDTGLQPATCRPEHTAIEEIDALWPVLRPHEWLVLYQHARRSPNWRESVADQLSSLCNNMAAHVVRSDDVGKDVAFICIEKMA